MNIEVELSLWKGRVLWLESICATDPDRAATLKLAAAGELLADVRAALINGGWADDALLRRVKRGVVACASPCTRPQTELAEAAVALVHRALALDELSPAARALEEKAIRVEIAQLEKGVPV